ncbi:MAG: hypothetical protein PVSMB7_29740 [Chloroflexota bacterium]
MSRAAAALVGVVRDSRLGISVMLLAGSLFVVNAVAVETGTTAALDRRLALDVHSHLAATWKPWMDTFSLVGNTGEIAAIAATLVILLMIVGRFRVALVAGSAPLMAAGLGTLLKHAFQRPRPHLWPGAQHIASYSFPSGHATVSGAFAVVVAWVAVQSLGSASRALVLTASCVGALGVGLSRVYLGVHWPTDVVGGYLTGLFATTAVIIASRNGAAAIPMATIRRRRSQYRSEK